MARQASADAAAAGEPRPVPAGASQRPFRLPVFDIVGLVLLAVSGATLLALLGLGPGLLSGGLAALLRRLFGVGAFPVVLILIAAGVQLVRLPNQAGRSRGLPWPRIVAAEILLLAGFALFQLVFAWDGGFDLARSGGGGGYLGWALATVCATLFGRVGAIAVTALVVVGAFGAAVPIPLDDLPQRLERLHARLEARLDAWQAPPVEPDMNQAAGTGDGLLALVTATWQRLFGGREAEELGSRGAGEPGRGGEGGAVTSALPHDRSPARPHAIPLPPLDLLHDGEEVVIDPDDATRQAAIIEETLAAFNIPAQVIEINQGPTVTQFGVRPGYIERKFSDGTVRRRKVKVSRITGLSDDLALALAARSIRVEAPVPGRPYIGIEIPNGDASMVTLKGILTSREFQKLRAALPVALGRDVSGRPVAVDLSRMPHLLIAGATGSGKSVCINTIVATLLFNLGPEELRLLMVDPKMVELIPYNGVPHLIAPVVTEVERVVGALTWAMNEMDRRYKRFSEIGVRNLSGYNAWAVAHDEETLPYIVIIIDELADLMMMAPDQVERIICRLAQMARATGMHLILATQRPSVDVVTGLIKANFPARIAFAVTSGIDSRVILDTPGAESLLGRGDMLFMAPESSKLQRLQGCFVSDQEINALTDYWRLALPPATNPEEEANTPWDAIVAQQSLEAEDELLPQAMELIRQAHWASTSFLQRKLRIGYSRAARLMDLLEARGLISPTDPENPARSREVYMAEDEDEDDLEGGESERDGRS